MKEAKDALHIWHFRPGNVASWPRVAAVERLLDNAGAMRVELDGNLILSFATKLPSRSPDEYRERISLIEEAIALKPDRHYLHRQLARELYRAGRAREAEAQLEVAEELTYAGLFSGGS